MRTLEDFPRSEWRDSTEKLRRIDANNAAKVTYKDIYWTVPLLLRLLDRVDELLAAGDQVEALGLAEPLPTLAGAIPLASERHHIRYYVDSLEAVEALVFAHCSLCSAYRANAKYPEARFQAEKALEVAARSSSRLAQAEAKRRAANLADDLGDFALAESLLADAIDIFTELEDRERLSLALICLGNTRNNSKGMGYGCVEYASAIYHAASARSERATRAICFAATNLAMVAARLPITEANEVFGAIKSASIALRDRPLGVPRLLVRWAEAIVANRCALGRYAIKELEKVRGGLLKRGALPQALTCISDLLAIVEEQEDRETLLRTASESARAVRDAIRGSTPTDELKKVVQAWLKQPVDVESLRKSLQLASGRVSRQG
ncbi:MAG: hypothetical protein MPN21_26195 [Thermoanaerobaculia bacterium]|nr:hypothetical protein [Thermoanaerobaculia bacterium]